MLTNLLVLLLLRGPLPTTVEFKTVGETHLQMDVYSPSELHTNMPCVVVVHGGAWIGGKREDMKSVCEALAAQGMVAATVAYRLGPKDKWPAMIEDVQDAVRYVREHAKDLNVDPSRIGAAGASAGGHLSLLLGTVDGWPDGNSAGKTSSKVRAVLDLFGPFDLSQDFEKNLSSLICMQVLGKRLEDAAAEIKDFSPCTYLSKDDAPVFAVQGKDDPLVPFKQAERLNEAYSAIGVPHEVRFVEGMKHGIDPSDDKQKQALADGIAWLKAQLAK